LIDHEGGQVGVIDRRDAQRMADEAGLDLVEIKPELDPPLCKIMDFGKYKYELSKKKSAATKASKTSEPKDIRLGRGATIDAADLERRVGQAREFLMDGHPVNFIQRFRGREMAHPEIGRDRLEAIRKQLEDISKMQTEPKLAGRQMNMLLVPEKAKIDALKQKLAAAKQKSEAPYPAAARTSSTRQVVPKYTSAPAEYRFDLWASTGHLRLDPGCRA
jgi:translation initiation factor IF-3